MRQFLHNFLGMVCLFSMQNAFACDVTVGENAAKIVSESAAVFWGTPTEAHLIGDQEGGAANKILAEAYNGKVRFKVESAVKGVDEGALVPAYFRADGTSCEMTITVGTPGFYFLRERDGQYYWGHYTQPDWYPICGDLLDVFESKFGVEFPLLRERIDTCRSQSE